MVFIYYNKNKCANNAEITVLTDALEKENIDYEFISGENLNEKRSGEAIFVLGGDGTVLLVSPFSNANRIPIISINFGKLGFLSEFEAEQIDEAVKLLKNNQLVLDEKLSLEIEYNGEKYFGLNDVYLSRAYSKESRDLLTSVSVFADNVPVSSFKGDGVIISTPTGSTAYSLSAGGSVLSPNVSALQITPIAPHSLCQRPIVCSAESNFNVKINDGAIAELFIDSFHIATLSNNDSFTVKKSKQPTQFLRRKNYNFFNILQSKFSSDGDDNG